MKKLALWLLPIVTLVIGFYLGSMNESRNIRTAVLKSAKDSLVIQQDEPIFTFDIPAGYETTTWDGTVLVWKKGRAKPSQDADAHADLFAYVNRTGMSQLQLASTVPKLLRSFTVSGYSASYYKLADEQAGNPYLVRIDLNGAWIEIESAEQKLLDDVLTTFKIDNN